MKKNWEGINNLINCKKKNRKSIISLKDPNNGRLVHDPTELSNIINNYFASIGPKFASNLPSSNQHFTD